MHAIKLTVIDSNVTALGTVLTCENKTSAWKDDITHYILLHVVEAREGQTALPIHECDEDGCVDAFTWSPAILHIQSWGDDGIVGWVDAWTNCEIEIPVGE